MITRLCAPHRIWAGVALLAILCGARVAVARDEPPSGQPATDAERIQQLLERNRQLEREVASLRNRLSTHEREQPEPEPVDIDEADAQTDEYEFLRLGVGADYLRQERWRIADQIESFIPPLFEPVRPFHAFILPPGAVRLAIGSRLTWNDSDFGRDDQYAKLFQHVKVRTQTLHFTLAYGFELPKFPDMAVTLDIPYRAVQVSGTGHPFRADSMLMTMDGSGQGIGDISVTLKKKWFDQGNVGVNFATFTGIIFPTGEDDQQFNRAQVFTANGQRMPEPPLNIFGRGPDDRDFPPVIQPGQGAWGFRVGAAVTRQFTRGALHVGAIADIFLDNDGITPGNEIRYGTSYVFPPFDNDVLAIDLSVFGRYKADSEFPGVGIMGPREDFKNGNALFFSPSLILSPNAQMRFFVSPEFRILEPNKGPSPAIGLRTGASFTF